MFGNYTAKDYENFNITVTDIDLAFEKICPVDYSYSCINRSFYGLVFITAGNLAITFSDKKIYSAKKGDILYLKKGSTYHFSSLGDENLQYVVVSFDILENGFEKMLPFERVNTPSKTQRFEELFSYLSDIWYVKSIGYLLHARATLELVIYELVHDRFSKTYGKKAIMGIQATAEYIERCFDKNITMENLAKMSSYSVTHYRRKFKAIYGVNPIDYANQVRVEKAKDLLKTGLYSVDEISARCGFNSVGYFTRVFKKITGTTPGKY